MRFPKTEIQWRKILDANFEVAVSILNENVAYSNKYDKAYNLKNTIFLYYSDFLNNNSRENANLLLHDIQTLKRLIKNSDPAVVSQISRKKAEEFLGAVTSCELAILHFQDKILTINAREIIRSIPLEKPAPIRVEIAEGRLVLIAPQTRTGSIDYPAANRIRESLRQTFFELLTDLPSSSNADKRFLIACHKLLNHLSQPIENTQIEALGLNYQLVERMAKRLVDEMGGSTLDEINHVLTGVGVLLNQFQEWRDYTKELSLTQISAEDSISLIKQAEALVEEFEEDGAPVDAQIALRLREMIEPVTGGLINADTVAGPLIGSLSNIFSTLSHLLIENIPGIDTFSASGINLGGSALLLSFSIRLIDRFCPMISQYQPLRFIVEVMNFFVKNYSPIKDTIKN